MSGATSSPRYTPPQNEPVGFSYGLIRLPKVGEGRAEFFETLAILSNPSNWSKNDGIGAIAISSIFADCMYRLRSGEGIMLGSILATAKQTLTPYELVCDGSIYNRVDYPELYAVLSPALIIDADRFQTPDLRNRFIIGASPTRPTDTTGGSDSITLTVDNLPSHTHTQNPHTHDTLTATAIPSGGLMGELVPFTYVSGLLTSPAVSGITTATNNATGNDEPIDTTPPFYALRFVMIGA